MLARGSHQRRSVVWAAAAAVMIAIILFRLDLSFDLSAFLPTRTSLEQDILIEQIRHGPASRLIIVGISGDSRAELAAFSDRLKQSLSQDSRFLTVINGEFNEQEVAVPSPIDRYYLLMKDLSYDVESLKSVVQLRLQDLALGGGVDLLGLIARDPFLVSLDMLANLAPADFDGNLWFSENGSAVLVAETAAASIDLDAQHAAVEAVRKAFRDLEPGPAVSLELTGVGAFGVELQSTIRKEATIRSTVASLALMLVLYLVFRKPRLVLLAALPLGMGFLSGLAVLCTLFDKVHGITLAFGFTMLGVAIDYPLHLFSHSQDSSGERAIERIWPTMRLGVLSTVIAYAGLIFAGSSGLAQLGIFTAAGVVTAMLVTRTWLPQLMSESESRKIESSDTLVSPALSWGAGLVVLVAALGWISTNSDHWDDELASLSPVPEDRVLADRELRLATATPDLRYQVVIHDASLEAVLDACEQADALLSVAREKGLLDGWQSACQLLPSQKSQQRRRDAIPAVEELRERVELAVAGTPFRKNAFEPFVVNASGSKELEPLLPEDIRRTPLRSWLEAHLVELDEDWVILISLVGPEPDLLAADLGTWPIKAELVDLQASSSGLMRDYRRAALQTMSVAAFLILGVLWYLCGNIRQMLWIGLTVAAALSVTAATAIFFHGALTVMHLVALLLVLGLGLDYALFLSRTESAGDRIRTHKGVLACAVSTTLAFAILAGSSIPVLAYLGLTVATGSAASYLVAYAGIGTMRRPAS